MANESRRENMSSHNNGNLNNNNNETQELNPYTKKAYTNRYFRLLRTRKQLPVWQLKAEFMEMLENNKIILVTGDTGSGKTTQIPQWCTEYCTSLENKIVICTQPRRITAVCSAMRVSKEMDVELSKTVGYSIRFKSMVSTETKLKYVTDGVLLGEITDTKVLNNYGVIVFDEVHERTLSTDVLLALWKKRIFEKKNIRVVVMSATMELDKFIKYFEDPPVLKISGFSHHVKVIYSPCNQKDYVAAVVKQAIAIHTNESKEAGDILIFLTGEKEIKQACESIMFELRGRSSLGEIKCIPLYSSLSPEDQKKIHWTLPENYGRKIIVSTNIAESSLTIKGVNFIIDSGFSKQKTYDPKRKIESLMVNRISRASADQRAGRAGRTAPGKCYRLYSKDTYNEMRKNIEPEIMKSNLSRLVLTLKRKGIRKILKFCFIDFPDPKSVEMAIETLEKLGALDDNGNITKLGKMMAKFPVDPQISKMLIASKSNGCTEEVLSIAAMLAVPSCYLTEKQSETDDESDDQKKVEHSLQAKLKYADLNGDHYTLLNLFNAFLDSRKCENSYDEQNEDGYDEQNEDYYDEQVEDWYDKQGRDWCAEHSLKYNIMIEAIQARRQLHRIMEKLSLIPESENVQTAANHEDIKTSIGRTLAAGFFLQVGKGKGTKRRRWYIGDMRVNFGHLGQSSCVADDHDTVIYNELVQLGSQRAFMSTISRIQPEWLP